MMREAALLAKAPRGQVLSGNELFAEQYSSGRRATCIPGAQQEAIALAKVLTELEKARCLVSGLPLKHGEP